MNPQHPHMLRPVARTTIQLTADIDPSGVFRNVEVRTEGFEGNPQQLAGFVHYIIAGMSGGITEARRNANKHPLTDVETTRVLRRA